MNESSFSVESVAKEFNRRVIFEGISFSLSRGESLAVTGRNGSGKSTLAKILCGLLTPTKGKIRLFLNEKEIPTADIHRHIGLVSPYITMYEEFSGLENLLTFAHIRNLGSAADGEPERLLRQFGIYDRRNDEVRTYSSGMKQRLKYAAAMLHHPEILILDEPTANLDEEGATTVRTLMRKQPGAGILIIATNDAKDLKFAKRNIDLNKMSAGTSRP